MEFMRLILRASLLLALTFLSLPMTQSQGRSDIPRGVPIATESVPVFSDSTLSAFINVHYRIPQEFFIYTRSDDGRRFIAEGEVLVELVDSENTSVARQIQSIDEIRSSPPSDPATLPDVQRAVSLSAPPGSYSVRVTVDDRGSGRTFSAKEQKVRWDRPKKDSTEAVFLFFAQPVEGSNDTAAYKIFNRGNDVLFGSPKGSGALLEVYAPGDSDLIRVEWHLNSTPEPGPPPQDWSGSDNISYRGAPVLAETGEAIVYRIAPMPASPWRTVFVPLPLELLFPGKAELLIDVTCGVQKRKVTAPFLVRWVGEPFSLRNLSLAVDALQFIVPSEELDRLYSTSQSQRARNLNAFWRSRDPDTTTAYNEAMAEYYRRVDVAIRRYSSADNMDGYKTDMGRIFILFGSPQRSERLLGPGDVPREIWTYALAKRRFVFSDLRKNGTYVLTASETL